MRAPVNIFGVPKDENGSYHIRNWLRVPLFTCTLEIEDNAIVQSKLPIRLEKMGELIAKSYYTCDSGVATVGGSTKHFVLAIENGKLRALVGIAFIDRSDAIDFSYLLHEFARRHSDLPVLTSKRRPLSEMAPQESKQETKQEPKSVLVEPPVNEGDSLDSDDDFGDFQ